MNKIFRAARAAGQLNLSNRNLEQVPKEVYHLADHLEPDEKWFEVVPMTRLDLKHNSIAELEDEIAEVADLGWLDVSSNRLILLPASIGRLQVLKYLNVSSNLLSSLPAALGEAGSLVSFNCSSNGLADLPESLGQCLALAELLASSNKLSCLPVALDRCIGLRKLELQKNRLRSLPDEVLSSLVNLAELNASENELTAVPPSVGRLSKLVRLDLHQNKISVIPESIAGCSALVELFLGYNGLESLHPDVARLSALRTLDLCNNRLREFPEAAASLCLHTLDLSNNQLTALPPLLGTMTSLRSLVLDGNAFRAIRSSLLQRGRTKELLAYLSSRCPLTGEAPQKATSGNVFGEDLPSQISTALRSATVSGDLVFVDKALTEVPRAICETVNVKTLDLSRNRITSLPEDLDQCSLMEALNLSDNDLQQWPAVFMRLPCIKRLILARAFARSFNKFPSGAFSGLRAIEVLDLTGVAAALPPPPALSSLPLLKDLRLSSTGLRTFPVEIMELGNLRLLDLSQNSIDTVPSALSEMTKLEELDLSNNNISNLPPSLGLLEATMRSLKVEGNPLRSIRRPILERGTKAILAYLKDKLPA